MDFIRSPKEAGCFMCRIVEEGPARDVENLVIHRGEHGLLVMNRYPYSPGHLMAAPYRHVATLGALTAEEKRDLLDLTCLGEQLLTAVAAPQGFNMGINQGDVAGAGLKDHLHMHLVPRWVGDTNFMPLLGQVRVIPQALEEMRAALAGALAKERERR